MPFPAGISVPAGQIAQVPRTLAAGWRPVRSSSRGGRGRTAVRHTACGDGTPHGTITLAELEPR